MEGKDERQRALNIIWNASNNYSLYTDLKAFDENGKADLYWNYIIGALYKHYDYNLLNNFFHTLMYDRDYIFYKKIFLLGIERCIFHKDKKVRPALVNLRINYAKKAAEQQAIDLYGEISSAYFRKVLGYETKARDIISDLLEELNFSDLNTEEVINKFNNILNKYFQPEYKEEFYLKKVKRSRIFSFMGRGNKSKENLLYLEDDTFKHKSGKSKLNIGSKWIKFREKRDNKEREFIENYFGNSIMGDRKTETVEKILCSENHENCHLHFTRGQFKNLEDPMLRYQITSKQREKNKKYYKDNYIRNTINIIKLTNKIKNALFYSSSYSIKSDTGKLMPERVWRTFLNDNKVFLRNINDELTDLSVDIMLDASASQIYRQEIIATEAYIIAESLTRCNIPVKVYSFCNMRDYTVINILRDYNEVKNNDRIFNYYAAGFNRDGMAIRTALYMMKKTNYRHKILIVLSDGKPNDMLSLPAEGIIPLRKEYAGAIGVEDTAIEVRNGLKEGITILCVFTGADEDLPSVKKIYGQNFARIKSIERFADTVGILIEKQLLR